MDKRQEYLQKIDAIPTVSFNKEQKAIAKKIIEQTAEGDLSAVFGLITQRVKTGFVFDEAPEVNHNAVALAVERPDLGINMDSIGEEGKPIVEHKLIIGENYDALKNLCATYIDKNGRGLIDVIYIDPPYNTEATKADGNDYKEEVQAAKFIYRDKFTRDGWLNMMNERLKLARRLLSDKGVIFISIDDSEQAYLKVLCDEVFGEEYFVATIPWRKRTAKSDVPHFLSQDYEWILCYAKANFLAGIKGDTRKYYVTDDFPNKPWRIHDMTKQTSVEERPNSNFTVINPKTKEEFPVNPLRSWALTQETFQEYYDANRIVFPGDYDFLNISKPMIRYWKEDDDNKQGERLGYKSVSSYINENVGMTQDGTKEITSIFGKKVFGFPKPLSLIKFLLKISNPGCNDMTILDFFAGSGTTGQAVMELNEEDGGKRRFILVTNNENGIGEKITRERLYRVINGKGSEGEEIAWRYSDKKACLQNNCVRVFGIEKHELTLRDLEKAEELKKQAQTEFKKLNHDYDNSNELDVYNELAALNPVVN